MKFADKKDRSDFYKILVGIPIFIVLFAIFEINPIIGYTDDGEPQRIAPILFVLLAAIAVALYESKKN